MATLDDIAKRLGITKGTVSKALNGADDVSESMRKAVLETAVELGYSRLPRSCQAPRICIFIENMSWQNPNDFGWDLVTGFRKMAEPGGYSVDIVPLNSVIQNRFHYDEYMLLNNYRGALFLGITLVDPWMNDFRTCRTPTVLLDNPTLYNPVVSQVGIDNDEGMEQSIRQLIALGHRTIGYLGGSPDSFVFQERCQAFFRALRKNAMPDSPTLAGSARLASECLEEHLPRLLKLGCTAVICSHDLLAHAVLEHCHGIGIRIPEDLSIIGTDDLPLCRTTNPPLSSIRQNRTELGKSAYYALTSQINSIHINTLKLHPEVIFRGSVGTAAAAE